jgi:hypothetical protein
MNYGCDVSDAQCVVCSDCENQLLGCDVMTVILGKGI